MRAALITAVLAITLALGLGLFAQSEPPGPRAANEIQPLPAIWYQTLPIDPERATAAYLARVPVVMRERGEAVSRSRYWALVSRILGNVGAIVLFLYVGGSKALDRAASGMSHNRWVQSLVYAVGLLGYIFCITLPVEVIASYMRYRAFGFSGQPLVGWLQDYAVGWASTTIFYAIGITILISMVRCWPRSWFLGAGLVNLVLALIYTLATPYVIEPLTNRYTPLPASPLKQEILAMAKSVGVPANNIYTSDASRQSRLLNGHVSGIFGAARITIDDTSIASAPQTVKALAAHEMGHYIMHHVLKLVFMSSLLAALGFILIAWLAPMFIRRMGNRWGIANVHQTGAIAIYWLLFTIWGFIAEPLTNTYSRVQEAQADDFGLALSRSPQGSADFMIHDADIARLDPTALDLILFYNHPSNVMRIRNAMQWRAEHSDDQ